MSKKRVALVALAGVLCIAGMVAAQVEIDSNTFGGLRARSIGPAVMSGRISAIDAVAEDPLTIYVGAASGGVWKSKDGGITWDPVFDKHTQSIGAIAIDPGNPEVVWVGTGETWIRNSVSVGTGLYKSTNGGDSWKLIGLEDSERIARIVIDAENTDSVYVCATGHLWDANEERGLYKTTDGGESWEKVLYVDEDTGCSDVAIDPQDPNTLYAGMWQFRRYPDFFESGGPGSGLHKSTDGGATWAELTNGLPAGEKGRIAVAVAPSRPRRVYAVVEADNTALYRSDDLGGSWVEVNNSFNVSVRPFYFAYIVVDPVDADRVYKPGFYLAVSTDGGKAFTSIFSGGFSMGVHLDHHALWVNPTNPYELVLGTDGGVYM
ncbi:MAG: glycosyl hydrolase, partial [Thermoanaerobaculia bacterium]